MDINQQHKPRYLHTQHFYSTLKNFLGGKKEALFFFLVSLVGRTALKLSLEQSLLKSENPTAD
jgi:hypothetical protein